MLSEIDEGDPLLAGVAAKIAEGHLAVGDLVLADDGGERRTGTIGDLHLGLHRTTAVGAIGADAGGPQRVAHTERMAPAGDVDDEHLDARCRRLEDALGITGEKDPVDPECESDPGRGRAAEIFDAFWDSVIATQEAKPAAVAARDADLPDDWFHEPFYYLYVQYFGTSDSATEATFDDLIVEISKADA